IRMYGMEKTYYAEREGMNSRLDEMQAAWLSVKLTHLAGWVARRREIARRYDRRLSPRIGRVAPGDGAEPAYHLYVVRVPARARVRQGMAERGILCGVHYPHPIHLMRGYAFLGHEPGSQPHAEALAQEVLSLPLFPELEDREADEVADALNELCG